ncbi:hypothetical protein CLV36_101253 [Laceyella sediminis]|uniref:Uncharacterized protein n=1 Tax=Laceyella sediminis TaxID=573074 RepID=A0ABX5ET63_9BACL|nr:hypothetical protein CLV36_101253 [Laceyella sediminis]
MTMTDYNIRIVHAKNKLSSAEIERRVDDFQKVFIQVASRYYSQKAKNQLERGED